MTLEEAFTGSECVYKSYDRQFRFKFNESGKIGIKSTIHYHNQKTFAIVKIIPTEQAKKWLMETKDLEKQF